MCKLVWRFEWGCFFYFVSRVFTFSPRKFYFLLWIFWKPLNPSASSKTPFSPSLTLTVPYIKLYNLIPKPRLTVPPNPPRSLHLILFLSTHRLPLRASYRMASTNAISTASLFRPLSQVSPRIISRVSCAIWAFFARFLNSGLLERIWGLLNCPILWFPVQNLPLPCANSLPVLEVWTVFLVASRAGRGGTGLAGRSSSWCVLKRRRSPSTRSRGPRSRPESRSSPMLSVSHSGHEVI